MEFMLRRLLQPLWVLLAIIFLIEAWLWDHLEPIVARVVAAIPLGDRGYLQQSPGAVAKQSGVLRVEIETHNAAFSGKNKLGV